MKIDARMVEIAKQIIAQSAGPFEPSEFRDRYEEALRALVESKAAGAKPARSRPAPAEESNVIDLMDALRRSLRACRGACGWRTAEGRQPEKTKPKAPAGRRGGTERRAAAAGRGQLAARRRRTARRRRYARPPGGRMNAAPVWTLRPMAAAAGRRWRDDRPPRGRSERAGRRWRGRTQRRRGARGVA